MGIEKFKLLDLHLKGECELTAKLEIDSSVKAVSIDFQRFEENFYGFQMPEDVQILLRNYPQLSQRLIGCLGDFLKRKRIDLPVDFSVFVRRQNIAVRQSEKLAA